jgi:hypothetical protein
MVNELLCTLFAPLPALKWLGRLPGVSDFAQGAGGSVHN